MATSKEFWEMADELKVRVRAAHPVKIRRRKLQEGLYGEVRLLKSKKGKRYFDIRISDFSGFSREKLIEILQCWTLQHEYSHVATWGLDATEVEDSHGPMWGLGMSLCEREVYGSDQ